MAWERSRGWADVMAEISYRRHRLPSDVIQHAVWLYLCHPQLGFKVPVGGRADDSDGALDLVGNHDVDPSRLDLCEQLIQRRPFHCGAGGRGIRTVSPRREASIG
jgi:hypothetical protein